MSNCSHCEIQNKNEKIEKIFFILAIVLFIISFFIKNQIINMCIYISVIILSGYELIIEGIKNIFKLNFKEDSLMTIAIISAFIIGEFPESGLIIILYKIGEILEQKAEEKSERNIEEISKIKEDRANKILQNGNIETIDIKKIKIGDLILIKPGEKVPLDCDIIEGESEIDASPITGESEPIFIKNGDSVLSGSINLTGSLKAKVEKDFKDSTASQIVTLVQEAINNKGKTEKFITKFARIYTPIIFIMAIIIAFVPPILGILDFKIWIIRGLSFLVASCPCSIIISVPLALFSCIGSMSKKGLLVKGTKHIENLSKASIIAFDKTGTLTTGNMKVDKIELINKDYEEKVMMYIKNMETLSNHPISNAIKEYIQTKEIINIKNFKEISGHGLYGEYENDIILLGNKRLLEKYEINFSNIEADTYLVINKNVEAMIYLKEEINEENRNLVEKFNLKNIIMLTGDSKKSAKKIANELKINEVYAELLPQEKQEKIIQIKNNNRKNKIIFVGDGINDAPVLAEADFGISMGRGNDIANITSDSILMNNKIIIIPECIKIAKKTMKIVKFNIIFSLLIKLLVLILSICGYAPIWLAVFADTGVTMLTVLNALRIR